MNQVKRVVVMAGGTGGHVFPGLAVADALKAKGVEVHWLGTAAGIEAELVPAKGFAITYLNVSGLRGQGVKRLLQAPFKLLIAVAAAMRLFRQLNADAVIGLGGYVTGPGGVAAWLSGRPLFIHEQNAVAGFTNGLLSKIAKQVLEAFPAAFNASAKVIHTGNPVRADIANLPAPENRFAERSEAIRILVLGGSQGAVALNKLVPEALSKIGQPLVIRHQAGKKNFEAASAYYQSLGLKADVLPFIDDMAAMYGWADLIICRSGALTVSEIAAAGVASVLIPFPFAVDDHQTANARYLSDAGAALLLQQKDLDAEKLVATIQPLLNREKLLDMAKKARQLAKPDATALVVDAIVGANMGAKQ